MTSMKSLHISLLVVLVGLCGCESTKVQKPAWLGINAMLGYPDFDGTFASAKVTREERGRYARLVSELGAPPVRDLVMSWSRGQPEPGAPLDFSLSDELVQHVQEHGADLLALCWGVPGWAAARPPPGTTFDFGVPSRDQEAAFRQFVRAFVERYDADGSGDMPGLRRPIRAYEFLQEMEDIPPEEYGYWLRVFYQTAKQADPQALVSVGSLRSPGLMLPGQGGDYPTYLERLLAASSLSGEGFPCFDVVSFHCFPESYPGHRAFDEPLAYIERALSDRGLTRPIWLTEFGCNAGEGPDGEQRQANRLVEWSLRARALGIERAYVYCLWDYHWKTPDQPAEHLGLVSEVEAAQDPRRKAAFVSMTTLLRELSKRPDVARRDENLYVLSGEAPVTFVMWQDPAATRQLRFLTSDWWEVRTLTGQTTRHQGSQISLTTTPVFIQRVQSPFLGESPFMANPFEGEPQKEEPRDEL